MPRTLVAGVDSSTQACKIVVCDADTGEVVRESRAAHPDGTEVSAEHWWTAYEEASSDGILDGVSALAVGGQQHGMVTLDGDDRLVRDALLWNDVRSAQAAADLVQELGGPQEWVDRVDVVPLAAFTVAKVRWLAEHEPDNAARTERVVLPHDWLTGRILQSGNGFHRWTTDRGDASGTGYWSPVTGKYQDELVRLAAGKDLELPDVLAPDEIAGRTDTGILVAPGTGDNMAAALSLGLGTGDAVVSLGTSGTVYAAHERPSGDPTGAVAGFADATGGHLPLMCTLNAARVLSAAASMLGTDLAGLDRLARAASPGAQGLVLLPYLDGERTPNLPEATGTLGGLTRSNATPENLARACVEGMLANLAAGITDLRSVGVPVERALLIGGAAASAAVREIAPMVLGVPVSVPDSAEYVALGAARQAAWVLSGGGDLPPWSVDAHTTIDLPSGDDGARIRERYDAFRHTVHG
ncbi:xylulokinase [Allobranchiibius sp. CTAmp26]|uniref:xylulokinase n=1 Tax=Allobranchiibius sp. CTAmp26 TaxID=2815214 RepID=UPI001AA0E687|nr:FGGY family carbohydrate kinase [Allobranchiibius sp. CTAmp26]MBO1754469.1 xylulose kinase [Allobranchiibius sp. CTAmp26]